MNNPKASLTTDVGVGEAVEQTHFIDTDPSAFYWGLVVQLEASQTFVPDFWATQVKFDTGFTDVMFPTPKFACNNLKPPWGAGIGIYVQFYTPLTKVQLLRKYWIVVFISLLTGKP